MLGIIFRHEGPLMQLRQCLQEYTDLWMKEVQEAVLVIGSPSGSPLPKNLPWLNEIPMILISDNQWGESMNDALHRLSASWICSVSTRQTNFLPHTLNRINRLISLNPAVTGIRIDDNDGAPLLYAWNRARLQKLGGWPCKKDWPFPEAADEFRWSTLPASEKARRTLPISAPRREESFWEQQKQRWIDSFLAGLERKPSFPSPSRAPAISILLSVYNEAQTIPWTLTSVFYQTHPDFELIVIDDGSTDTTAEEVQRFRDPRIRWLPRSVNRSKVYCLNEAWREARGEWLLELDADDWLGPEALDWVIRATCGLPEEVALVYGDRIFWHEEPTGRLSFRHRQTGEQIPSLHQYLKNLTPLGPRIYRQKAIRQIGGWPVDDYGNGRLYEDIRVVVKLLETHRIHYTPGFHYHVRLRADSVSHQNVHHFLPWKDWLLRQDPFKDRK